MEDPFHIDHRRETRWSAVRGGASRTRPGNTPGRWPATSARSARGGTPPHTASWQKKSSAGGGASPGGAAASTICGGAPAGTAGDGAAAGLSHAEARLRCARSSPYFFMKFHRATLEARTFQVASMKSRMSSRETFGWGRDRSPRRRSGCPSRPACGQGRSGWLSSRGS